jgi:hypothetical protein
MLPDGANAYPAYECCRMALNAYPAYNFPACERLKRHIKL